MRRFSLAICTPVLHVIERIVAPLGLRVDESSPWLDARLSDGSRVHAIIPLVHLQLGEQLGHELTVVPHAETAPTYDIHRVLHTSGVISEEVTLAGYSFRGIPEGRAVVTRAIQ